MVKHTEVHTNSQVGLHGNKYSSQ